MKCSQYGKCKFSCDGKVPKQFSDIISTSLVNVMVDNKLPEEIATKISTLLSEELDASAFCNKTVQQQHRVLNPKTRILDRAIINKFEQYYKELNDQLIEPPPSTMVNSDLFQLIPRGECLNSFLDVIKLHCIGPKVQVEFESKLSSLTEKYTVDNIINWQSVYQTKDYALYMDEFFSIFFNRIKEHTIPLPALNNQLDELHKPSQINQVLRQMAELWRENV
jgi:hypothetical protein